MADCPPRLRSGLAALIWATLLVGQASARLPSGPVGLLGRSDPAASGTSEGPGGAGGTVGPGPVGRLPCDLRLDFDLDLDDGDRGFKVVAKCKETISDVVMSFMSPSPNATHYAERRFVSLEPHHIWVLAGPFKIDEFMGYTFRLSAVAGSKPGMISVTLDQDALPPPVSQGTLPCLLTLDLEVECSLPCFSVSAKCSKLVSDVRLEIPDFDDKLFHDLEADKEYLMCTLPREGHEGQRFTLIGTVDGGRHSIKSEPLPE